jgi:hypothetical protein
MTQPFTRDKSAILGRSDAGFPLPRGNPKYRMGQRRRGAIGVYVGGLVRTTP